MKAEKTNHSKVFQGTVVSNGKMKKTVIVKIERKKTHPKYGKQYVQSTKFHVHDEKEEYKAGDVVRFVETRPFSRTKRWRVTEKVTAA